MKSILAATLALTFLALPAAADHDHDPEHQQNLKHAEEICYIFALTASETITEKKTGYRFADIRFETPSYPSHNDLARCIREEYHRSKRKNKPHE